MATDEERAAIMAEYMNQVDNDNDDGDDEEEEFQGDYFDDDDDDDLNGSDAYGEDDDDDDDSVNDAKEKQEENYAILQGNLTINDEGKLIYSGTWSMKQQNNGGANGANGNNGDAKSDLSSKKKKKKTKFKLKSKRVVQKQPNGDGGDCFTLTNPLSSKGKLRSILFDGFFTTDETDKIEPYRKIKERDIEMTFSAFCEENTSTRSTSSTASTDDQNEEKAQKKFLVNGKGCNDFGAFTIRGVYDPLMKKFPSADNESNIEEIGGAAGISKKTTAASSFLLICHKKYEVAESQSNDSKKRKRSRGYDSEEDYDFSDEGDEGANYSELIGLHEEAGLSVEELKKRYYGGSISKNGDKENQEEAGGEPDAKDNDGEKNLPVHNKRIKTDDDDDDDDGCGF